MRSGKRLRIDDNVASTSKRATTNYYLPLQIQEDGEKTNDGDKGDSSAVTAKKHIPPITIVKRNIEQIHSVCKESKIIQYSIRKLSIGHKLFCEYQFDYDNIVKILKEKQFEFFSYSSKNNRPFKVVLSGLDKQSPATLKADLLKRGLWCSDVKLVERKTKHNTDLILYIIYLKKGSITIKELREKYQSINHYRVKWSYQTKFPNKITQCYNCQMYGHGSDNCNIKSFCARCSGPHATAGCVETKLKCANCKGDHLSSDPNCPSRISYISLRERFSKPKAQPFTRTGTNNRQPQQSVLTNWNNVVRSGNCEPENDLFSIDELKNITLELITSLKNCKSKSDQFHVITNIAFKFLP